MIRAFWGAPKDGELHYELKSFAGPFSEQYQKWDISLMVIIC